MDITDPFLDGFDQDTIDQLDNRSIRGGKLIKSALILGAGFNFKIFSGIGHQGTEILDLGDLFYL